MVRLFIEGNELDVTADFSHEITYAIDDIQNIDSKKTAFSKTIVLAGTKKNNQILGNIFEFANSNFTNDSVANVGYNFNAMKSASIRLEFNGLQIMKGVMRLLSINIDGANIDYEIALFGELGGLTFKLGNNRLEDIDFSLYNHVYNIPNIVSIFQSNQISAYQTILDTKVDWFISDYYVANNPPGVIYPTALYIKGNFLSYFAGLQNSGRGVIETSTTNGYLVNNISSQTKECYFSNSVVGFDGTWTHIGLYTYGGQVVYENHPNERLICKAFKLVESPFTYPLIDYGNCNYTAYGTPEYKRDFTINAFKPAIYVKEYIDRILKNAGYTYESNFFLTSFFKSLIIPCNQTLLSNYRNLVWQIGACGINYTMTQYATNTTKFKFTGYFPLCTTTDNEVFKYTGVANVVTINFRKNFTIYARIPTQTINVNFYKNSGGVITLIQQIGIINYYNYGGSNPSSVGTIQCNATTTLLPDDLFWVEMSFYNNNGTSFSLTSTSTDGGTIISSITQLQPVTYNSTISLNDVIPRNILQKDFLVSIMKMFNLMITEDKNIQNHLIIEPYVNFYDLDRSTYIDWSDKVDRSKLITITPMAELNSRYYEFKYKSDSDYWNDKYRKQYSQGYGDRVYDNGFEFTQDVNTTDVIFSATPLIQYASRDKIISAIYKYQNNVEDVIESNIRILQKKTINCSQWKIYKDSANQSSFLTSYPYAGHFDNPYNPTIDINFGATKEYYFPLTYTSGLANNLFNVYYSSYMAEITDKDSRVVTFNIKLKESDIYNLDFGKFIFIDGVLYRLITIKDYNSNNDTCKVDLLRVIYTTY